MYEFPKGVYPIGRLDKDSEGLLILTNDRFLHQKLLHPENAHEREYWVQVHGGVNKKSLEQLEAGVTISVEKQEHLAKAKKAEWLDPQPNISPRNPPISPRGPYPVPWIKLVLTEGKFRQVRKMTAMAGLPTLRLIRKRIAGLKINFNEMAFGEVKELSRGQIYESLFGEKGT